MKSIQYYYLLRKLVNQIAYLVREVIRKIKGFVKKNTLYIVLSNLKRKLKKD